MDQRIVCPVCNTEHNQQYAFCPECGCNLTIVEAVSVTVNPTSSSESFTRSLKSQVQKIGKKAQQGLSEVSSVISEKAGEVSIKASNAVVEQKVTEAMGNLVNLMINVSKDIATQIPPDMLNAIDLEAEINFIAFTIGVSIDLADLNISSKGNQMKANQLPTK
jgi:hypothetical protein